MHKVVRRIYILEFEHNILIPYLHIIDLCSSDQDIHLINVESWRFHFIQRLHTYFNSSFMYTYKITSIKKLALMSHPQLFPPSNKLLISPNYNPKILFKIPQKLAALLTYLLHKTPINVKTISLPSISNKALLKHTTVATYILYTYTRISRLTAHYAARSFFAGPRALALDSH